MGGIVAKCIKENKTLEDLSLEEYRAESTAFDKDLYESIDLLNCVERRISEGGAGSASVNKQLAALGEFIADEKNFY